MRKISARIFDDRSSAKIPMAYAYTIQLHAFAIQLSGIPLLMHAQVAEQNID